MKESQKDKAKNNEKKEAEYIKITTFPFEKGKGKKECVLNVYSVINSSVCEGDYTPTLYLVNQVEPSDRVLMESQK